MKAKSNRRSQEIGSGNPTKATAQTASAYSVLRAVKRLRENAASQDDEEFRGHSRAFFEDSEEYSCIQALMKLMLSFNWTTTQREGAQQFLKGKVNLTELLQSLEGLQDFIKDLKNFVNGTVVQVKKDAAKEGRY